MKTLYNYLVLALLIAINTSCLKAGLDELETYDQNEITNVRFEYRWWDEVANRLRVIEMEVTKTIDNKSREIVCSIKVPEATSIFTTAIRVPIPTSQTRILIPVNNISNVSNCLAIVKLLIACSSVGEISFCERRTVFMSSTILSQE